MGLDLSTILKHRGTPSQIWCLRVLKPLFISSTHTAASVRPARFLVHSNLPADPVDLAAGHRSNLGCHLGIVDEALGCLVRRSRSYFVHQADLLYLDGTGTHGKRPLRICGWRAGSTE